jgi:MFS family permease
MNDAARCGAEMTTETAQQDVYRLIFWRLMPVLMVCYVLNYIDRSNIGLAKLQFMHDLGMPETAYGLAAGAFYLGYVSFGVPVNMLLARIGARRSFLLIMTSWGILSAALAFVSVPYQFYGLRFFVGVAETGFLPAVLLYMAAWVPQRQRARFNGVFLSAIAVAGLVGGPLGGAIMSSADGWMGLRGWQLLFLIEGLPACMMGMFVFFYIDERPQDASWLAAEQKTLVAQDLAAAQPQSAGKVHISLGPVFRDVRFLGLVAIAIAGSIGTSAIGLWLPTIIRNAGITDILQIGLLSAIPNGVAIGVQYINARHSDISGERHWHAAGPLLLAAASWCAMPFLSHSPWLSLLVLTIITSATFAFTGPFWSMPTAILSGPAAAGGLGVITSMLGLGSFLSPILVGWLTDRTHTMAAAEIYFAAVLSAGAAALLLSRKLAARANR